MEALEALEVFVHTIELFLIIFQKKEFRDK
jgi:hypothetical protein